MSDKGMKEQDKGAPIKGIRVILAGTAVALILGGVALFFFVFSGKAQENRIQNNLRSLYAAQVSNPNYQSEIESTTSLLEDTTELPGDSESKRSRQSISLIPVFLLKIPKIDLDVVVAEGTSYPVLEYAVGHFTGTALPGQIGNLAMAAHRSFVTGEFFNRLDEVEIGDELIVDYNNNTYVYITTDAFVVGPYDVWVLDPTEDATITLVTCTPITTGTHRLIVKGVLLNSDGISPPTQR